MNRRSTMILLSFLTLFGLNAQASDIQLSELTRAENLSAHLRIGQEVELTKIIPDPGSMRSIRNGTRQKLNTVEKFISKEQGAIFSKKHECSLLVLSERTSVIFSEGRRFEIAGGDSYRPFVKRGSFDFRPRPPDVHRFQIQLADDRKGLLACTGMDTLAELNELLAERGMKLEVDEGALASESPSHQPQHSTVRPVLN